MARIFFYKELNKMSTADFYTEKKNRTTQASKELFEIERVISKRGQTGKVSDRCVLFKIHPEYVKASLFLNDIFCCWLSARRSISSNGKDILASKTHGSQRKT